MIGRGGVCRSSLKNFIGSGRNFAREKKGEEGGVGEAFIAEGTMGRGLGFRLGRRWTVEGAAVLGLES
jgi:hypothetical protein